MEEVTTSMQNPIFRILGNSPYIPNPTEFYDIIKHVFPFEKIEIIN
jgi:hypothetical protein